MKSICITMEGLGRDRGDLNTRNIGVIPGRARSGDVLMVAEPAGALIC
jgi:hypothetical protein